MLTVLSYFVKVESSSPLFHGCVTFFLKRRELTLICNALVQIGKNIKFILIKIYYLNVS